MWLRTLVSRPRISTVLRHWMSQVLKHEEARRKRLLHLHFFQRRLLVLFFFFVSELSSSSWRPAVPSAHRSSSAQAWWEFPSFSSSHVHVAHFPPHVSPLHFVSSSLVSCSLVFPCLRDEPHHHHSYHSYHSYVSLPLLQTLPGFDWNAAPWTHTHPPRNALTLALL